MIDLKIARGEIAAMVSGSEIYRVKITIVAARQDKWKALCAECAGSIDSLVELLQGKFSKSVMEKVCSPQTGLFPSPKEIKLSCSCPDWAVMCKHVAAVLYGVGARLDTAPEMLFGLRGVDHNELVTKASEGLPLSRKASSSKRVMSASDDLGAIFGLEMADGDAGELEPVAKAPVKKAAVKKTAVKKAPAKKAAAKPVAKSPVKKAAAPAPVAKAPVKKAAAPAPVTKEPVKKAVAPTPVAKAPAKKAVAPKAVVKPTVAKATVAKAVIATAKAKTPTKAASRKK